MSSHAVGTSDLAFLRYFDLVVLGMALPTFALAGLPLLGWGAATAAWLTQRGIAAAIQRRAEATDDLKAVTGLVTASMIVRGWLMALSIFAAGLVEREAGLAAAILSLVIFTVYFGVRMAMR